jgi:rhamnose transport system permease protein
MKFEADKRSGSVASRYLPEALAKALAETLGKASGEASAAIAYIALLAIVAVAAPGFYSFANLRDLAIGNAPALIVAVGMTMVILTRQIDISVGSQFAVCSVAAGLLAKTGMPAIGVFIAFAWGLKNLAAGRAVYAVGSDAEAARLAGVAPSRVIFGVFALMGALTGVAATLNSIRFTDIQSNAGVGLELKAIAAVVVGGTAINGGRGKLVGTLIGVALLGTIGTALTFLGVNPFWEKAIQGAIILASVASDVVFARVRRRNELHNRKEAQAA